MIDTKLPKKLHIKLKRRQKIVFKTHHLGEPLDNLTRDDFYPDPKILKN